MNKPDMNNFLCQFDFSSLQELDPGLVDGYNLSYSKEVPFEIRMQEHESKPQEVGSLDVICGDELNAQSIKIVLTSEHRLVNENDFEHMQNNQKLMINFSEYLPVLIKMFNSCIKDPQSFLAIFTIKQNGIAQLEFIKNMEYKFIELLVCQFIKSSDEITKENITYRYNVIKSKNGIMYNRLKVY
ncbi:hypothetical protein PFHG_04097 [Plasmodium falciparum HB3]|uniref:Spindle assembly abnormal protein 6 N-terminal domain-containing protein n=1 Tax=Plasmodium falciparum (isolate HB3) TaxID=137071 RepID=A0A0L7KG99_PLAFX|nr:hypothetical protein PFHG_04097 [Plasmodium falciparum HB3]